MATYTSNYNLYMPDPTDPVGDFRSKFNSNMQTIDQNLGGGGGGGGHTIVNPSGSDMPAEGKLQFTGGVTVTDDSANGKTVVDVSGGGGGGNVYGAFIDTNRVIASGSYSLSLSYTATEDCFLYTAVALNSNTGGSCAVDGKTISSWWNGTNGTVAEGIGVYLKSGQTFTATATNSSSSGYYVYGLTQGTESIFTPIIYSDTERCIGVWRDNKPLYQRSWTGTKSTSSDEIIINDPPSIDTLANSFVTFKGSTGSQIAQYYRDSNDRARIWLEGGKIHMDSGGSYPIMPYTYTVTLQYTKTTDSPCSGNWNTDGVPTVHYSTSEQVIGTWIDGKPLYQITVDVPTPANDSNEHLIDLSSLSIEECPYLFGYAVRHSGANDITYYANSIETDSWYYFKARYDNFRDSIMYTCLFRNDSISRMRITIQYTKTTD